MKTVSSIFVLLLIAGCSTDKPDPITGPSPQPSIWAVVGTVEFWEGDFMPTTNPDAPTGTVEPVSRTIYIHEATTNDDVVADGYGGFYSEIHTPLVTTVVSNIEGKFSASVPPGTYSLFVAENGLYYANLWSDSYIQPITVALGQTAEVVIRINYRATY